MYEALMLFGFLVSFALTVVLLALAGLHVYWGNGGLWPGTDETSLARMVVGAPAIQSMPSQSASYTVGFLLFLAGLWPMTMLGLLPALAAGRIARPRRLRPRHRLHRARHRSLCARVPGLLSGRALRHARPARSTDRSACRSGSALRFCCRWDGSRHDRLSAWASPRRHRRPGRLRQDHAYRGALPADGGRRRHVRDHQRHLHPRGRRGTDADAGAAAGADQGRGDRRLSAYRHSRGLLDQSRRDRRDAQGASRTSNWC